jgi:hypothetical protein
MPDTINIGTNYWQQPDGHEHHAWTAWYEDDEPDDFGVIAFGYGPTKQHAICNLRGRFPKED